MLSWSSSLWFPGLLFTLLPHRGKYWGLNTETCRWESDRFKIYTRSHLVRERYALEVLWLISLLIHFVFPGVQLFLYLFCVCWILFFRWSSLLLLILGHSFVFRREKLEDVRLNGHQLGIPQEVARVRGIGVLGMLWSRVVPEVHCYVWTGHQISWCCMLVVTTWAHGSCATLFITLNLISLGCLSLRFKLLVWCDIVGYTSWNQG